MTADDYLKHAEECERLAALAELDSNKRALLQSAEMWRRLAAAGMPTDRGSRGPPFTAAT
jgi:hypothetical protein